MPDPLNDESVPPETVTSPTAKLLEDSDNVNVIVSVWPLPSVPDPERVIVTVGAVVSIVTVFEETADKLPPASTA